MSLTNVSSIESVLREIFQRLVLRVESLLESITATPIRVTRDTIAILSLQKNDSIRALSQLNGSNGSVIYSTKDTDVANAIVSISIEQSSFDNLSDNVTFIIYYLPSSIYQYAQEDHNTIVVSPVIGVHLPGNFSRIIRMVFTDQERSFGRYSCVFWDRSRWNDSGCNYTSIPASNRHLCVCHHTTSFALIFIPDQIIPETYLASIIISSVSMACLTISIILSIYRQLQSSRSVSIVNLFSLLVTLLLFIFLTIFLVRSHRPSKTDLLTSHQCQGVAQSLAIATYFFLILTFASKTLLGIYYFSTVSFRFLINQSKTVSARFLLINFAPIIGLPLILTITVAVLANKSENLLIQYGDICWFRTSYPLLFVTIPILFAIGINLVLLFGIAVCLLLFIRHPQQEQQREKRLILGSMIWIASCISLGVAWVFGPFLGMLIKNNNRSATSITMQWVFSIFVGLEGLWVLLVNIIFFIHQKFNVNNRLTMTNKTHQ